MSGPYFSTWERENLIKFCQESYEKLQRQEEELQELRWVKQERSSLADALYERIEEEMQINEELRQQTALRERLAQHEALDQLIADSQAMGSYSLDQIKAVLRQDDPQFDERMQQARERLAQPYCDDCGGTDPECPLGTHWEGCEEVHPECRKTRREWAGLTDREIEEIARHEDKHGSGPWHLAFARAIEAKLKEQNA